MDFNQLDVLEAKVTRTVQMIKELQSENNELKNTNFDLSNKLQEKEQIILELTETNERLKEEKLQSDSYKEKEEKIQQKVEDILIKLETIAPSEQQY